MNAENGGGGGGGGGVDTQNKQQVRMQHMISHVALAGLTVGLCTMQLFLNVPL